jgi:crossover junction endodeoxyribonuclease RuvC
VVVLGIDPGSRRCGYGIVSRSGSALSRVDSGVLVPGPLSTAERLGRLFASLAELFERGGVDAVAVETAFCGRSPRSALALGQARGVALAAAARAGLPVFEYAPAEVKRSFTGNGRAEKVQMVRTARALFGVETRLADEADALAVAVCHLARASLPAVAPARRAGAANRGATGAAARSGMLRRAVRSFRELP